MKFVGIKKSTSPDKRFTAVFTNKNKTLYVNFGFSDYLDYPEQYKLDPFHANRLKNAYRQTYKLKSPLNLFSPQTLSYFILWNRPTYKQSIDHFKLICKKNGISSI
jgi:hypothetical protein